MERGRFYMDAVVRFAFRREQGTVLIYELFKDGHSKSVPQPVSLRLGEQLIRRCRDDDHRVRQTEASLAHKIFQLLPAAGDRGWSESSRFRAPSIFKYSNPAIRAKPRDQHGGWRRGRNGVRKRSFVRQPTKKHSI
jgi:hypothetical protein